MTDEVDIHERLDEMEDRLERVHDAIGEGRFEDARAVADGLGDIIDCPLCHSLETGVLGAVLFAAGFTENRQAERVEAAQREVEQFIEQDLAAARDALDRGGARPAGLQT